MLFTIGPCISISNTVPPVISGTCAGAQVNFADAEVPAGPVDGINFTFTLANVPSPVTSLQLFRNGLLQKAGIDYTLSGKTITFLPGAIPQVPDSLQCSYRF